MELIYLLIGETAFLIKNKIIEIQSEALIDDFNVIKFDSFEEELKDMLQELNTVSFFDEKKLVIIQNANQLKRFSLDEIKDLEKYLRNPNEDTILILTNNSEIEDKTLKTLFNKYCYIEKISNIKLEELPNYIYKNFKKDKYEIDEFAIKALISRIEIDQDLLEVEINKLKTFAYDSKVINEDNVIDLVPRTLEDNIFYFSQKYLNNEVLNYMNIYYDLIGSKITPLTILNHLFNNINLLIQVKILLNKRCTREQIAETLAISPGRTYYLINDAKNQSLKSLQNKVKELANLDLNIKLGLQEEKVGLELLLLGKR